MVPYKSMVQQIKDLGRKVEKKMENGFQMVRLSVNERGLLRLEGTREVVLSVKTMTGADETDNDWLMENMSNVYSQYCARVNEYRKTEGK